MRLTKQQLINILGTNLGQIKNNFCSWSTKTRRWLADFCYHLPLHNVSYGNMYEDFILNRFSVSSKTKKEKKKKKKSVIMICCDNSMNYCMNQCSLTYSMMNNCRMNLNSIDNHMNYRYSYYHSLMMKMNHIDHQNYYLHQLLQPISFIYKSKDNNKRIYFYMFVDRHR